MIKECINAKIEEHLFKWYAAKICYRTVFKETLDLSDIPRWVLHEMRNIAQYEGLYKSQETPQRTGKYDLNERMQKDVNKVILAVSAELKKRSEIK